MVTVLEALLELITDLFLELSIATRFELRVEVAETFGSIYLVLFNKLRMLGKRIPIKNFHTMPEHDRVRHLHHRRLQV